MEKRSKYYLAILIAIILINLIGINAYATQGTKVVNGIKGSVTSSNTNNIPKTIEYNDGEYRGTLKLERTEVVSGNAPYEIVYKENRSYVLWDYCVWNKYSYTMNFVDQQGAIPWSKVVSKDGKTFTVNLTANKYHEAITSYSAPNYYVRGHSSYTEYGDTFTVSEQPWIGSNNVLHDQRYHTAKHYYSGYYYGSTMSDDTRVYRGVYSGEVVSVRPKDSTVSIKGYKYAEPNTTTKWVNAKDSFIINTTTSSFDKYSTYPNKTILYVGGTGIASNPYQFTKLEATTSSVTYTNGKEGNTAFKPQGYVATRIAGTKKLSADHRLIANSSKHGLKIPIYSQGENQGYYTSVVKGTDVLAVDSNAPVIKSGIPTSDWIRANCNINISADDLDSGISATCC